MLYLQSLRSRFIGMMGLLSMIVNTTLTTSCASPIQSSLSPSAEAVPAVLPVVSKEKKTEIQRALAILLRGSYDETRKILISNDALTKTSLLTLEKKVLLGRELGLPDVKTFQLLLDDNGMCFLHYQNTNTYERLNNAECLPEIGKK